MEPPREEFHSAHHASIHGADGANGARDTASAQAYRRIFEMMGLRVPPREGDASAARDLRKEILGSVDTAQHRNTYEKGIDN
jgi:phosphoribulokinase